MSSSPGRTVAIVSPRYAPAIGGVERHVERVATGLVRRGVPVDVIATDPSGKLPRVEMRDGVTVRRFPTLRGDDTYYVSPRLLRWLRGNAGRYALLHAHNYQTLVPAASRLAARHAGIPLVVTPHYHAAGHTWFRSLLHIPYRPLGRGVMRAADGVIANSVAEAGWIERDFGVTASVIPNGVDMPATTASGGSPDGAGSSGPSDASTGEVSILSVGRLAGYKQVARVVTALPFLPSTHVLTVVGEGPDSAPIAREAARLGVTDRVRLLGHVSAEELAERYAAADLFVTLSREESFGLTVLEAAAAGAPVVASDIPAHREVTGYANTGRIVLVDVDARDADLARAMERARAAGRSSDRTGWRLPTWEQTVDGVLNTYEVILGAPLV
ncbi:MAG: hypothetical protein QOH61_1759 [Chloroflexota bacterium]|nr:hypothetical protein [Chloroflexota bacterium]